MKQCNSSVRTQAALSHRTVTRATVLSRSATVRKGEDTRKRLHSNTFRAGTVQDVIISGGS